MDLQNFIDSRIEQVLSKSQFLNSLPCEVLAVEGQMATVRLTTNDVVYTVPSYIGSVAVGDYVKLYFNGISPNERNSYIGASLFANGAGELTTVVGKNITSGTMVYGNIWTFDDTTPIQRISFLGGDATYGQAVSSFDVYSPQDNDIKYALYVNNALVAEHAQHVTSNNVMSINFVQPFIIPNRENVVEIRAYANSNCYISNAVSYVSGFGITDTSENRKLASLNITYTGDGTIQAGSSIEFDVITENNLNGILYQYQPEMNGKFHVTKNGKTVNVTVDDDAPTDGEFILMISTSQESTRVPFRVTEAPFSPTSESDYIIDEYSNIIHYIGSSVKPEVPNELNDLPVRKLYATAFNYSNVKAVYIPEGIVEIE